MLYYSIGLTMGSLVFTFIFYFLYFFDKRRSSLVFSLAFLSYSLYYGISALVLFYPPSHLPFTLFYLFYIFHLLGVFFILLGSARLLGRTLSHKWLIFGVLTGILFFVGMFFFLENPLLYMAFYFILSLYYIQSGILFLQSATRFFAPIFFLLGSLLFCSFFFLEHPWYFGLVVVTTSLGLLMSTGILILYFKNIIKERDRVQRQLLAEKRRLDAHTKKIERLYHQLNNEIEKAHKIHQHLLPKTIPSIEGFSFAAFYQPAELLGGDFYDVMKIGSKLIIYLSDVSGHGLDTSMLSIFIKQTINGFLSFTSPEHITPENILQYLTLQFRKESYPEEMFICIFLLVLDLETREMIYTGAGFQDTPFLQQGSGERVRLLSKGLFINTILPLEVMNFQEKRISLTPGSTIFFNTDGLTEQGKDGVFYRERLKQVFYNNAHETPDLISQAVVEDFRQFNDGSIQGRDDITFFILKMASEDEKGGLS